MTGPFPLDAYRYYEREWEDLDELRAAFEWEVPDSFNVAEFVVDRWRDRKGHVAVFAEAADGDREWYTFHDLYDRANRVANALAARGLDHGDRVGVNTGQRPETLVAHLATWKLGAVSVPLSTQFGTQALRYRLDDCAATACFVDDGNAATVREVRDDLDALELVVDAGSGADRESGEPGADPGRDGGTIRFEAAIREGSDEHRTAETDPGDPAAVFYTSGTTGPPKGVVQAHRFFLGTTSVFLAAIADLRIEPEDLVWTPVEWSWAGSLPSYVLDPLMFGVPVVAYDGESFDPETAFGVIERYGVTVVLLPPTALRMLRSAGLGDDYDVSSVRVVSSAGESLGASIREWADGTFDDCAVNEAYGQTEAIGVVGECTPLFEPREGSMGKPLPGHDVRVVDPETADPIDEPGVLGEIAVRYADNPVCFTEYWNNPEGTERKVENGWLLTEDLGEMDADGYVTFVGRTDDVIISAGYRIGPEEIEDVLAAHEAVATVGVSGVPDEERGEVPAAFVVLAEGWSPSEDLVESLQDHVRRELADYQYPREVRFVEELPRTTTGKIRRSELDDYLD